MLVLKELIVKLYSTVWATFVNLSTSVNDCSDILVEYFESNVRVLIGTAKFVLA